MLACSRLNRLAFHVHLCTDLGWSGHKSSRQEHNCVIGMGRWRVPDSQGSAGRIFAGLLVWVHVRAGEGGEAGRGRGRSEQASLKMLAENGHSFWKQSKIGRDLPALSRTPSSKSTGASHIANHGHQRRLRALRTAHLVPLLEPAAPSSVSERPVSTSTRILRPPVRLRHSRIPPHRPFRTRPTSP